MRAIKVVMLSSKGKLLLLSKISMWLTLLVAFQNAFESAPVQSVIPMFAMIKSKGSRGRWSSAHKSSMLCTGKTLK